MNEHDLASRIKNIDDRTARIEQVLPTLATKDDLNAFATKDDLKPFITKEDAKAFLTKEDANAFATKEDAKAFATKDDVREEGARTRRHFDVVAEQLRAEIGAIAEGHETTKSFVAGELSDVRATLSKHDRRIMKLEAKAMKRR